MPGGVGTFGEDIGLIVEDVVEDGKAEVGDAQFVDVGEDEGYMRLDRRPGLEAHVIFAADITAGFFEAQQFIFEQGKVNGHDIFLYDGDRGSVDDLKTLIADLDVGEMGADKFQDFVEGGLEQAAVIADHGEAQFGLLPAIQAVIFDDRNIELFVEAGQERLKPAALVLERVGPGQVEA